MSNIPKTKRRVSAVIVDRANYGRLFSVLNEIRATPGLELSIVCSGTVILERFGMVEKIIENDGFRIDGRVYTEVEGSLPITMAKSIGLGIVEFTGQFDRLKPDIVLIIGDRFEALAAAVAAAYMNLFIAHIQGGELSGSIDETTRHAITKLSHLHLASTDRSASYIKQMGENHDYVFNVGCPSGDYIKNVIAGTNAHADRVKLTSLLGCDFGSPYLLVIFHPVTTDPERSTADVESILLAVKRLGMPTLWLWPNIDAGADKISKRLRQYRDESPKSVVFVKNFDPALFAVALAFAACAVGNSSSFVRDSSFSGVPVVLVGSRQRNREVASNVVFVEGSSSAIEAAVDSQIKRGNGGGSTLYGDGTSSRKIASLLSSVPLYRQKQLQYPLE